MPDPIQLSQKPPFPALKPADRLVAIRRAQDEADPALRVAPVGLQALANALSPLLTSNTAVTPRAANSSGPGVPDVYLADLQSQLNWLFAHAGSGTTPPPAPANPTVSNASFTAA